VRWRTHGWRLAAALGIALTAAPASPTAAEAPLPPLQLSATVVPLGSTLTVTGRSCRGDTGLGYGYNAYVHAAGSTGAGSLMSASGYPVSGTWTASLVIGPGGGWQPGHYVVKATCYDAAYPHEQYGDVPFEVVSSLPPPTAPPPPPSPTTAPPATDPPTTALPTTEPTTTTSTTSTTTSTTTTTTEPSTTTTTEPEPTVVINDEGGGSALPVVLGGLGLAVVGTGLGAVLVRRRKLAES
jgi:hypothetical protein